jgi:hypothetical protein
MRFFTRISLFAFLGTLSCTSSNAADQYPPWKIGLSYEIVQVGIDLTPIGNESEKLTFRPSASQYAGVILGYRWLAGTLAFAVPADRKIRDEEGTSKYTDLKVSYYVRNWGVEAGYNNFKGYLIENSERLSAATLAGARYYRLPEMQSQGYGLNFFYVADPGKYSMPAAFDQSEPQSGSAGSFIALASIRHQGFQNSGQMIPSEKASAFGGDSTLRSASSTSAAVGGGYGFLWDGPSAFFASLYGGLTAGMNYLSYELANTSREKGNGQVNIHLRLGFGVNSKRGFLKVTGSIDNFNYATSSIKIGNTVVGAVFAGGLRF